MGRRTDQSLTQELKQWSLLLFVHCPNEDSVLSVRDGGIVKAKQQHKGDTVEGNRCLRTMMDDENPNLMEGRSDLRSMMGCVLYTVCLKDEW